MKNLNIQTLRRVAGIGLAIVLLVDFVLSLRARGGWGLGLAILFLFPIAVTVVSFVLMPGAFGRLLGQRELLVPLGLAVVAGELLGWLGAVPGLGALLEPSLPVRLLNFSLGLSLGFLLKIGVAVAYAAWMTGALLHLVRTGNGDPCCALPGVRARFWRVFGLEFVGWGTTMLATSLLLLTMPVLQFFALVPLAIFGVAWNLATAAVLPVAFESEAGFWPAFRAGMAASLLFWRKWWLLLLAQMILLGFVFFYHSSGGGHTQVSWSVNVFWAGGYENDCRWYGKLAETTQSARLPIVDTLLGLLFGAFAIAIKLTILQRLQPAAGTEPPPMPPASSNTGSSPQQDPCGERG